MVILLYLTTVMSIASLASGRSTSNQTTGQPPGQTPVQTTRTIQYPPLHHLLIPGLIEDVPQSLAKVIYNGSIDVEFGMELTPTQVKDKPNVTWNADPNSWYTVYMTDPDAGAYIKHGHKWRHEWHHWLVVNIPGNDVAKGRTLSEYIGAAPPRRRGMHRYVFLVFKQPGNLVFNHIHLPKNSPNGRDKLSIQHFVTRYGLGKPIAGNYFISQYDDYVRVLNEQMVEWD
jgi:hypothetical protein